MRVDRASLILAHTLGFIRQAQPGRLALGLLLQGARRAPRSGRLYDERESTWWGHTAGGKAPAVSQTTPVRPGGANAERGHECGCIHAPSSSWWRASSWPRQRTIPTCRTRQTQRELGQTARNGVVATLLLKPSFTPRRCGGRDESASHVRFLPRSPCARPLPLPTPLPVAPPPAAAARDAAFAQASNTGLDVFGTLGSEPGCDGSSAGRLSAPSGDGGGGDGDDGGGGGDGGGGDGDGGGQVGQLAQRRFPCMFHNK